MGINGLRYIEVKDWELKKTKKLTNTQGKQSKNILDPCNLF